MGDARRFISASGVCAALALGFALALWGAASPAAAVEFEDVRIPWIGGRTEEFSDAAATGELTAKLVRSAASPSPYVVFLHGCGGLHLDNVRHWADFFSRRGVGVLMVDSFTARGRQEACSEGGPQWSRRRADDAASALAWLRQQDFVRADRLALMGQSQGGTAVLLAAQKRAASSAQIVGAIAMYPACAGAVRNQMQFDKPLVVLMGDADTWTPAAACQELKALQEHPSAMELTVYPGARHSFDNPGVYRLALGKYPVGEHAASRDKARERVAQFIEQLMR
jgi:dienelactone hydrolase